VNAYTVDLQESGRKAAEHLLSLAHDRKLISAKPRLDFVD
jgi:predicted solute-binding protein